MISRGWLGGGSSENTSQSLEPLVRSETLTLRSGLYDAQRQGSSVVISPDRRLAAIADSFGRVAVLDVKKGHLIRLFKGYRDAQCAFVQVCISKPLSAADSTGLIKYPTFFNLKPQTKDGV